MTETFLEDIDATWRGEGYNSRSEFIRDAVRHPDLTRESWKEIAAVEHARRTGDSDHEEKVLDIYTIERRGGAYTADDD